MKKMIDQLEKKVYFYEFNRFYEFNLSYENRIINMNDQNIKFELNLNTSKSKQQFIRRKLKFKQMLQSLPFLRKQLDKIHGPNNLNPDSKIQKYQKKILELLIRQKTTLLENQQLNQQLQSNNLKLNQFQMSLKTQGVFLTEKQQENTQLRYQIEKLSESLQNLDIQNKMNQMGRMNEEEKCSELLHQIQVIKKDKISLQTQISKANQQIKIFMAEVQQKRDQAELNMRNSQQKSSQIISQKDQIIRQLTENLQQTQTELQSYHHQITSLKQIQLKLQQKITQLSSSQTTLKLKINEAQFLTSDQLSKINQLTKELHLAKLKNKQYEETLYSTEIQQGQQSLEFSKLDKENKRIKKQLSQLSDKIKELQDQKTTLQDKNQQLNKSYKLTKKELQKLKESLSQANDNQTGTKSKIDKLQLSIKNLRVYLQDKQEQLVTLKSKCQQLQKQSELFKNQAITSKFNLEEIKKKYDIVVQARSIAEEKLVLQRQQNSKSLSSMIKEKDFSYRQNYKLLQLLEIKDKTIQKITNGLKNMQNLESQLSLQISPKQNIAKRIIDEILTKDITSHKDRVKLIDEHLQKFKL